jgi:hypothetical protein
LSDPGFFGTSDTRALDAARCPHGITTMSRTWDQVCVHEIPRAVPRQIARPRMILPALSKTPAPVFQPANSRFYNSESSVTNFLSLSVKDFRAACDYMSVEKVSHIVASLFGV